MNIPPFRGEGGHEQQVKNSFRGAGGHEQQVKNSFRGAGGPEQQSEDPFSGSRGDDSQKKPIKIGLLIQDKSCVEAKQAAELAIRNANSRGSKGIDFELIVRSMEGPWGTGSKAAVTMIFDEDVVAIMGSHDGRNAHLVEQVATKSRVVFLSAWSSDPSLAQAFVPWFFNSVPNDLQQAEALTDEIYNKRKLTKTFIVSDNDYDSQSALKNFLKIISNEGRSVPILLASDSSGKYLNDLTGKISAADNCCVVLFVRPPKSATIAKHMKINHLNQPVFAPLALLDESKIPHEDLDYYENMIFVSSLDLSRSKGFSFYEEYRKEYGSPPGAVAAYAYDGMNILIEAIRSGGTEREKLQETLKEFKYEGISGIIQFDEKGNRKGTPGFVQIKNGIPVSLK